MNKMMYFQMMKSIRDGLPQERRDTFDMQMSAREKSPSTALLLSLCMGMVGGDRFYLGDIGLGLCKLVTFGGLGVWALIDLFRITDATRRKNIQLASEIKMMLA